MSKTSPRICQIDAPCKINLHLRVGGLRSDGFHELESIFLALDFGDTLRFELAGEGPPCRLRLTGPQALAMAGDAGEDNLVSRAVRLFRARTGFDRPLEIVLEKRVPLGGGLGGGSSDAASTLLALNTLSGAGLTGQDLGKLAVELGSDVPFFLTGGLAWVTGRGERIEALEWSLPPGLAVVLVNPGFPSVTAGAFTRLDVYRAAHTGEPALDRAAAMAMLGAGPEAWTFRNDFLPVFLAGGDRQAEAYGAILGELRRLGAAFAGLSGAGSTCFGIFRGSKEAEKALGGLKKRWECVYIKIPLAHSREVML